MPNAAGLYYFVHGGEHLTRPPVVMIHGPGDSHLAWPAAMRRLPGERIYALDLPGHGSSEGTGRHDVLDYARDVIGFMDEVGLRTAVIVGHSLGGAIALTLAVNNPEHVLGLCLIGAAARMPVNASILSGLSTPDEYRSAVSLISAYSYASETSHDLKKPAEQRMLAARPAVLQGDFVACDSFDLRSELPRIQVPTLILCGAEDRIVPVERARATHGALPNATLRIIAGAGHMVMLERPVESASELERFLDRFEYRPGQ